MAYDPFDENDMDDLDEDLDRKIMRGPVQSTNPFAPNYEPPTEATDMPGIEKPVEVPDRETVEAHLPITISIDVDQLLRSELGWTSYNAGSYDDPEPDVYPGGNGRIIDVVAQKLAKAIETEARQAVVDVVKERALAKVDALIEDVMNDPIQLTSEYGEAKSPVMTMREAMVKAATDRLLAKVDQDGKIVTNHSYGRHLTYVQWHAERMARDVLDKELSKQLSDAGKAIKNRATEMVSAKIAEVLGKGF